MAGCCWSFLIGFAELVLSSRNERNGEENALVADWGSLPADIIRLHLVFRPLRVLNRHWCRAVSSGIRHANIYPRSDPDVGRLHQSFPSIQSFTFYHGTPIDEGVESASRWRGLRELGLDWPLPGESDFRDNASEFANSLTGLVMHSTGVTDNGCQRLARLTNLRNLTLFSSEAGVVGFSTICSMVWLTSLAISLREIHSSSLVGLTNLSCLDLYRTGTGDKDAHYVAQLTKLTSLGLGFTYMADAGIEVIAQSLTNLIHVDLKGSCISEGSCSALAALTSLRSLNLAHNLVGNLAGQHLALSSSITELHLSSTLFDEVGCQYIGRIPQLADVRFAGIRFREMQWSSLGLGPSLVRVNLDNTNFGKGDCEIFTRVPLLTSLSMTCTGVVDRDCPLLCRLTNLVELNIHGTSIGNRGCRFLVELTKLTRMDVGGTNVDDRGCFSIGRLTGLRWLNVDNECIGDSGLKRLAGLVKLIYLHHGPNVTDVGKGVFPFLTYGIGMDVIHVCEQERILIW